MCKNIKVLGAVTDDQTRCIHYHSALDVIAIKFKCCGRYYPCYKCHNESEAHPIRVWKKNEFDEHAILCGVCKKELTIEAYLHTSACPYCHAAFNPGCKTHLSIYFDVNDSECYKK